MRRQMLFLAALPCLLLAASARAASHVSAGDAPKATPGLLRELDRGAEELPILIGVKDGTPSARALRASPDPEGEPERRVIRVAAQKRLAEELTPQRLAVKHYYESFSILAGTATREAAMALAGRSDVAWVDLDRRARLLQTTPQSSQILVRSDQTNALGFRGAGQAIAVIDTGVDYMVADLGGAAFPNTKVIGGTDIADKDSDPMDCDGHGTSIAGVAAGPRGVAPDAKIVAIKVFSSKDATNAVCQDTASFSDIIAGINYAITNRATFRITAINISLGGCFGDSLDHGYCDSDDPASAAAIDSANAAGLVVAVAAGNDGLTNQLSDPACVSSAVSVGAVYPETRTFAGWAADAPCGPACSDQPVRPDGITCFSDSTSILSLLAPGAFWNVVTKGGGQDSFSGTSPAAAAVSGAVVLLRQARPDLSPVGLVGVLRSTGKPIADSRNGVVTPRIDTLAAVQLAASALAISPATAVDIPDASGFATATATISGFTRPLANVQVWVEINHPSPEQLRVTLIGPDGTSVVLQDQTGQDEHPINAIYGKTDATAQSLGAFAGKPANGTWTLKVEDLVAGVTGRIKAFEVTPIPLAERQSISKRSTSAARVPRRVSPRP
jgi:subtilisin-like proprotein convertase family protein